MLSIKITFNLNKNIIVISFFIYNSILNNNLMTLVTLFAIYQTMSKFHAFSFRRQWLLSLFHNFWIKQSISILNCSNKYFNVLIFTHHFCETILTSMSTTLCAKHLSSISFESTIFTITTYLKIYWQFDRERRWCKERNQSIEKLFDKFEKFANEKEIKKI